MPGQSKVFISYKRNIEPDDRIAQEVYKRLSEKHDVFIDRGMKIGTNWGLQIEQHIRNSDFFICFISNQSVQSDMVKGEIETAYFLNKEKSKPVIFPVRLNFTDALVYPLSAYLNPRNYFLWKTDTDTDELMLELETGISGRQISEQETLESLKKKLRELENKIKSLLSFGEYNIAYKECETVLSTDPYNAVFNLLFVISALGGRSAERLNRNIIAKIENHIQKAIDDEKYQYLAYIFLGIIKYDFFVKNGMYEGTPSLVEIKNILNKLDNSTIDFTLLNYMMLNSDTKRELGLE
jgi:hypothetical protein